MDNQNQEHQHKFLDYGEDRKKCPCGVYDDGKASRTEEDPAQRANRENMERSGAADHPAEGPTASAPARKADTTPKDRTGGKKVNA